MSLFTNKGRGNVVILLLIVIAIATSISANRGANPTIINRTKVVKILEIDVKVIAHELLTPKAFKCWSEIVKAESHFNPQAKNLNSTATGIGQLLSSTYRNIGMRPSSDPKAQFIAQLAYISRHYGGNNGLCLAYRNELQFHNY